MHFAIVASSKRRFSRPQAWSVDPQLRQDWRQSRLQNALWPAEALHGVLCTVATRWTGGERTGSCMHRCQRCDDVLKRLMQRWCQAESGQCVKACGAQMRVKQERKQR